jgi:hypothetical protein
MGRIQCDPAHTQRILCRQSYLDWSSWGGLLNRKMRGIRSLVGTRRGQEDAFLLGPMRFVNPDSMPGAGGESGWWRRGRNGSMAMQRRGSIIRIRAALVPGQIQQPGES